ncbi:MAG: hypothetical protein AB8C46_08335 [Burkholderiaceae bacterium]
MTAPGNVDRPGVARALAYPYGRPPRSFLFSAGEATELTVETMSAFSRQERQALTPVLAVGSNASPEQLRRKYGQAADVRIPVTLGWLSGADIAYCAYMTGYGSVPATLFQSAGVRVPLGITWLPPHELSRMHGTEAVGTHTDFGAVRLDRLALSASLALPDAECPHEVFTYCSRLGLVAINDEPVGLAELGATGRTGLALTQQQLQRRVRRWSEAQHLAFAQVASGEAGKRPDFAQWVSNNVRQQSLRDQVTSLLQASRIERPIQDFEIREIA